MRNPIRLKNLSMRFVPYYVAGLALLGLAHPTWRSLAVGSSGLLAGLALRAWGAGHLVKTERFAVSGPYAHVRHPLYLGTLLIGLGFGGMLGGWVGGVVALLVACWFGFVYFPRKERIESSRLLSRYGDVYQSYRQEVPALCPRVTAWKPEPGVARELEVPVRWQFSRYDANNEHGTFLACVLGMVLIAMRVVVG